MVLRDILADWLQHKSGLQTLVEVADEIAELPISRTDEIIATQENLSAANSPQYLSDYVCEYISLRIDEQLMPRKIHFICMSLHSSRCVCQFAATV